jgi:outer membrane protein
VYNFAFAELHNAHGECRPHLVRDCVFGDPEIPASIEALIDRAMENRPELMAQTLRIRSAEARIRAARAEYKPQIVLSGSGGQTAVWPASDHGQLGPANEPTWSVALGVHWRIFDGGVRKNELLIAESKRREAADELAAEHDRTTREVWTAYIAFRTALRKHDAAVALLSVSARSELFLEAVNLEFATGNLLRNQPPATRLQSQDGHR